MASLCLACCSTILQGTSNTYKTDCCNREICNSCLSANPRLKQYNPCLSCCRGVQVVKSPSRKEEVNTYNSPRTEKIKQDAEAFVIGEEDDDQETGKDAASPTGDNQNALGSQVSDQPVTHQIQAEDPRENGGPAKYWLRKGDTLQGIALRFKLNVGVTHIF